MDSPSVAPKWHTPPQHNAWINANMAGSLLGSVGLGVTGMAALVWSNSAHMGWCSAVAVGLMGVLLAMYSQRRADEIWSETETLYQAKLSHVDRNILINAQTSVEYDQQSSSQIKLHLNANHPGWSLASLASKQIDKESTNNPLTPALSVANFAPPHKTQADKIFQAAKMLAVWAAAATCLGGPELFLTMMVCVFGLYILSTIVLLAFIFADHRKTGKRKIQYERYLTTLPKEQLLASISAECQECDDDTKQSIMKTLNDHHPGWSSSVRQLSPTQKTVTLYAAHEEPEAVGVQLTSPATHRLA